jgi:cell shape-determining protein MreC
MTEEEQLANVNPGDTGDTVSRSDYNKVQEQLRKLKADHSTKLGEYADLSSKYQNLSALAAGLQQHSQERDSLVMQIRDLKKAAGGDITDLQ